MGLWVASYASCSADPGGALRPRAVEHCATASERDAVRAVLGWMDEHRDVLERDADLTRLIERSDPATRAAIVEEVLTPERLGRVTTFRELASFIGRFQCRLDAIVAALGADGPGSALDLRVTLVPTPTAGLADAAPRTVIHTATSALRAQH